VVPSKQTGGGGARLADVARLAGVGVSIASRVLNDDPTVSTRPETRERIVAAARELDYRPSALARGLRLSRTMSIGIVVDLAFYHENAEILAAVERAGTEAGFVTLIADTNDFAERGDAYRRLLKERRVDGILIASLPATEAFIEELEDERLPIVVLNRAGSGTSVSVDEAGGMRAAAEHLLELGHERIGYVAGPARVGGRADRRVQALRDAMRARGVTLRSNLIAPCACDGDSIFQATLELLAVRPRPTALCVWSSTAAVAVLAAAKRCGLVVPADLSIISYNDSPLIRYLDPPITAVRMPLDEMARAGVQSLLRIIRGEQVESLVMTQAPLLLVRGSTRPAPPGT
jgi:LacI family transcriptional regulator